MVLSISQTQPGQIATEERDDLTVNINKNLKNGLLSVKLKKVI